MEILHSVALVFVALQALHALNARIHIGANLTGTFLHSLVAGPVGAPGLLPHSSVIWSDHLLAGKGWQAYATNLIWLVKTAFDLKWTTKM